MKWRVLISILLTLQVFQSPASAEISDFIDFPYNSSTFDSDYRYGKEYKDSIISSSWDRLRKGPAPWTGSLTIIFSQDVNSKKYTFETALKSPSGKMIPLPRTLEYISKSQFAISCYGTYCQTQMLAYAANLPIDSEVGKYSVIFTARWVGVKCTGTVCESNVPFSKSIEAIGALEILGESSLTPTPTVTPTVKPTPTVTPTVKPTPTATPTVKPTPTVTPTVKPTPTQTPKPVPTSEINPNIPLTKVASFNLNNGQIGCNTSEFTKAAIDRYEIIGTRWRIKILDIKSGARILDEYNWGLSLDSVQTTNGLKFSSKEGTDPIIYAYTIRNQAKGATYECSVAIRTKNGNGPYSIIKFRGTMNSKDFNLQTITCIKGKVTKEVTAVGPKCPAGYKKK